MITKYLNQTPLPAKVTIVDLRESVTGNWIVAKFQIRAFRLSEIIASKAVYKPMFLSWNVHLFSAKDLNNLSPTRLFTIIDSTIRTWVMTAVLPTIAAYEARVLASFPKAPSLGLEPILQIDAVDNIAYYVPIVKNPTLWVQTTSELNKAVIP